MNFSIQPVLENEQVLLKPLQEADLEALYATASDPRIWEQHPNRDRWKREVFLTFFEGAMQSGGAFAIIDKATGRTAGSTRFYGYDEEKDSINIGYTFYGVEYWGRGINPSVKQMMLAYIFPFVSKVCFHVGANNIRSQIAIGRLGAEKVDQQEVAYFGEAPKLNYMYCLDKAVWQAGRKKD